MCFASQVGSNPNRPRIVYTCSLFIWCTNVHYSRSDYCAIPTWTAMFTHNNTCSTPYRVSTDFDNESRYIFSLVFSPETNFYYYFFFITLHSSCQEKKIGQRAKLFMLSFENEMTFWKTMKFSLSPFSYKDLEEVLGNLGRHSARQTTSDS